MSYLFQGCKLRSHTPKLRTNDDTCIQKIIDLFPDLIKLKHADDNVTTISESYNLGMYFDYNIIKVIFYVLTFFK